MHINCLYQKRYRQRLRSALLDTFGYVHVSNVNCISLLLHRSSHSPLLVKLCREHSGLVLLIFIFSSTVFIQVVDPQGHTATQPAYFCSGQTNPNLLNVTVVQLSPKRVQLVQQNVFCDPAHLMLLLWSCYSLDV